VTEPLPRGRWTTRQSWRDLAFLHWPVDAALLRPLIPEQLDVDERDGVAWLGVVPFRMTIRARGLPPLPGLAAFPELNVRTYVSHDGRPGVWFFSLDCANRVFVEGARRLYRLPYVHARMRCEARDGRVEYASHRPGASFAGSYRGDGAPFRAEAGSLEEFLTERYSLFAGTAERLVRADVQHAPWPLERGDAEVSLDGLAPVPLPDVPPHVLVAARVDVLVWAPVRV
jgi:uncharacterized protein YqjF (DUF2071 family)